MKYCILFSFYMMLGISVASQRAVLLKSGLTANRLSDEWKAALVTRMPQARIDSFAALERRLYPDEVEWLHLIHLKLSVWNSFRDSLHAAFPAQSVYDTIYVMVGYLGADDGFTYGLQTVCLDLTALASAYGDAKLEENNNRIDRIFAHEYTHLLHKAWVGDNKLAVQSFSDSIHWECLYEGVGMYRSLNQRWLPAGGVLPGATQEVLEQLYPVFTDRMIRIATSADLSYQEKEMLNANLSRGPVSRKWGAFTVAIWLLLETGGDAKKLAACINEGPAVVIRLAKKYLPLVYRQRIEQAFQ